MKNILIIATFLCFLLASCKKEVITPNIEPDPIVETPTQKFLMGFTYENNYSNPVSIKYDAQGRVTWVDDGEDVHTITYPGSEITVVVWRKDAEKEVFNFKGKLNADGNLIEGSSVENYTAITNKVKYKFEYDAEGYMTRKLRDANDGQLVYDYYYYYTNGNMTEYKAYKNGEYDYGGTWEYDADLPDNSGFSWEKFGPYNNFTGKNNRNLMVKYTGNRPGTDGWWVNFSYEMDASGYPVSSTSNYYNGVSYTILFDYQE